MGRFKRALDEIRLNARYACRRMGIPRCQVHQIYLSKQQLIYIPIPKNACTSVKYILHEIESGKHFDTDLQEFSDYRSLHDYYLKRRNAFTSVEALKKKANAIRFALVRDPVRRLISCYRNRVVDLGDLELNPAALKRRGLALEPDLNTFVIHLEAYRAASKSIDHHSRPQARFLGGTIEYLDRIFTLSDMDELLDLLRQYHPDIDLQERKTGGTKITLADLSEDALQHAIAFYQKDYELLSDYFRPEDIIEVHQKLTDA